MSATPTPRLKVSREGLVLIKSFEGFRPRAVQATGGHWVIGYGHTASAREGLTVAEADAELLLQYDLLPVVKALNEQVPGPLNQHQFDALTSFAASVGVDQFLASDVLQRLKEGRTGQAADALIGWPEDVSADARLRRRAAERALFVADPASPVTLAELLAAPLPPPPITTAAALASESEAPATDARAAALATLLGEMPEPASPEPVAPQTDVPGQTWPEPPVFQSTETVTRVSLDRYSPYAAAIVGPLPGFATAAPVEPPAEPESLTAASEQAAGPEPTAEPEPAHVEPTASWVPPVSVAAAASTLVTMDPGQSQGLVLTPATEADFAETERPAWSSDQRHQPPATEETVLFEDEPTLSVLRHEVEAPGPRRFDWNQTGAFLIMGGVGLLACAFSAAAFRLAVEKPSPMGETVVVGWALALIGVICVGVSSWNLYVRWSKSD